MYALMPDEPLKSVLEAERLEFAEKYNTRKALTNPIHVTLIPPFHFDEDEQRLIDEIEVHSDPFYVRLTGYASFKRNLVFYVDVEQTPALMAFQSTLADTFQKTFPKIKFRNLHDFHPHITLGYRDLTRKMFEQAMRDHKNGHLRHEWVVNSYYLWKYVSQQWQVIHSLPLQLQPKSGTQG